MFILYIINILICYIVNNILISYDCMYVKRLRAILIDRALITVLLFILYPVEVYIYKCLKLKKMKQLRSCKRV